MLIANYDIDIKLSLVWTIVVLGAAAASYTFLIDTNEDNNAQDDLTVQVSDDRPQSGQKIEIVVLQNGEEVEASSLTVNGESYANISILEFTVPDKDRVEIIAELDGSTESRTINVDTSTGQDSSEEPVNNEEDSQEDTGSEEQDDGSDDQGQQDTEGGSGPDDQQDSEEETSESSQISLSSPEDGASFTGRSDIDFVFDLSRTAQYYLRVNGERVGEGETSGTVTETVNLGPGTHDWFVRVVDGQQVEQSSRRIFTVNSEPSIAIDEEFTGLDDYILDLGFTVENAEEYRILLDGEEIDRGQPDFSNTFTQKLTESKTYEVTVEALRDGESIKSVSRAFNSPGAPTAQVNWLSPNTFDTTAPETEFGVNFDESYSLVYTVNQDEDVSDYSYFEKEDVDSSVSQHSFVLDPLQEGTHSYSISVRDQYDTEIGVLEGEFETTEQRPVAKINEIEYVYVDSDQSSQLDQDAHRVRADITAYENLRFSLLLDGSYVVEDQDFTGSELSQTEDLGNLNSGQEYVVDLNIESTESSKTLSDQLVFTAQ